MDWLGIILSGLVLIIVGLIVKRLYWRSKPKKSIKYRHVVVTGGSSGIGKSVAILAARMGAHVTIIARDVNKLKAARNEIIDACLNKDKQRVEFLSLDIGESYEKVEKAFAEMEKAMGPVYMLANCAGTAILGKIEDTRPANLSLMMNLNFMATYYCIKAVVPNMKSAREGIIVLTSSQAALLGIFGCSAYCSTKFALRGLAESIAMELSPYNISVTLNLPPDTDTPGFAVEELTKPQETKLICSAGGLVKPEEVAEGLLNDALNGKFFSTVGLEGLALCLLSTGMSPFESMGNLLLECALMAPMRLLSMCLHISFKRIIKNCMTTRDLNKKSN